MGGILKAVKARWRFARRWPGQAALTVLWRLARGGLYAGAAFAAGSLLLVLVAGYVGVPPSILMIQRSLEGASVRRVQVPLSEIDPALVHSVIGAEDSNFCSHHGFDVEAIRQALQNNAEGGRRRGASTLSQQTAKNVFLWNGGGWARKGAEAWFTFLIELTWPKRRIMEAYLNIAEWGDGIFGAEAVSRIRFDTHASELSGRQAALLAAVLPNPNEWRLDPPGPYVSGRAGTLEARAGVVRREGYADCVLGE
ncbi:monofunctional biosynthetic peptidoglycan transglycosylase [Hyphobacterium sp. SN044]|uniref:monofunctional biosynthetic peptidoglycan transglycosylase n=1 Tax=Hyphobacterium sp. SN044 TaxID=2912575 RepID=UPI001F0326AB|nr:monofunctional biosynthetic peptidoglycan transglycosylase [Hyphobacterium sp. SN044]MCF8880377.1 monofunctional biosynthetic peptidoglycan transglycosylase [Hyphobacterium sp. SN044]